MLTYAAFVEELRSLLERGRALRNRPKRAEDDDFRRWHHELTDLIQSIEAQKYRINCGIVYRQFDRHGSYSHTPSPKERLDGYNRDLDDTLTELETLVSRYEKYGDPKARVPEAVQPVAPIPVASPAAETLKPPEKVTLAWLWQHSPIALWLQLATLLLAVFAAGVTLGQSVLYAELSSKLQSPKAASPPQSSTASRPK